MKPPRLQASTFVEDCYKGDETKYEWGISYPHSVNLYTVSGGGERMLNLLLNFSSARITLQGEPVPWTSRQTLPMGDLSKVPRSEGCAHFLHLFFWECF